MTSVRILYARYCPDGRACGYAGGTGFKCRSYCFRVKATAPVGGAYPHNLWPPEVLAANMPAAALASHVRAAERRLVQAKAERDRWAEALRLHREGEPCAGCPDHTQEPQFGECPTCDEHNPQPSERPD